MAYVLGFLCADGYVMTNPRGSSYFCFCSTDRSVIEQIRTTLGSNHAIGSRRRAGHQAHWKTGYYLQIGDKKAVQALARVGIRQNKSLSLRFPSVPPQFLGDFVRGYFDGDGSVLFVRRFRQDRQRWYNDLRVRFTSGSKKFLKDLHESLRSRVHGGTLYTQHGNTHQLIYSKYDGLAIFSLMYDTDAAQLRLERKFRIFEEAHRVLDP